MRLDVVAIITSDVVGLAWDSKGRKALDEAHVDLIGILEIPGVSHIQIIDPIHNVHGRSKESIEAESKANLENLRNADLVFLYNPNGTIDVDSATLLAEVGNSFVFHGWQTPIYVLKEIVGAHYLDIHCEEIDPAVLASQLMRENRELTRS